MSTVEVTTLQIEEWKGKYGEIIATEFDGLTAYLRKPNRTFWAAAEKATQSSSYDGNMSLVTNCWLGGDEILKTEMKYVNGIAEVLLDEVKAIKPIVKKL